MFCWIEFRLREMGERFKDNWRDIGSGSIYVRSLEFVMGFGFVWQIRRMSYCS